MWSSVWSKVEMIYICCSWCPCHPIIFCFIKILSGLTFLVPAYSGCPGREVIKWVSVDRSTELRFYVQWHKIGPFGDVLPSQSLKKLNITQQKHIRANRLQHKIARLECGPMPSVMVALLNIGVYVLNATKFGSRPLLKCRAVMLPKYESAKLGGCKVNNAKWILHLAKFRNVARSPENVYVVYQHRRRPNTMQTLVGFCWVMSLQ